MSDPVDAPVYSDPITTAPGYFMVRLVKGGPEVPCRLWRDEVRDEEGDLLQDVRYHAAIDTDEVDPASPERWPWTRIPEERWKYLTELAAWSRQHDPDGPAANPRRPIRQSTIDFV